MDKDTAATLVIIGASVRAAAFSAMRAGLRPWCADLFADADLQQRCPATRIHARDYPHGLIALLDEAPPGPWLYTGALENRAQLVRTLSRKRQLWGNDTAVLRRVRSPLRLAKYLERANIPCPRVRQPHRLPRGLWLAKPVAGAGGHGIFFWPSDRRIPRSNERRYLQEVVHGEPCAAIFAGDSRGARLLGVTQQLIRAYWSHAKTWQYAGSIGPLRLSSIQRTAFERLGHALVEGFSLRGLFGVDCVLNSYDDGLPYPVEVNPRYTASVEVLEHATGIPILALHRRVFDPSAQEPVPVRRKQDGVVGKAILFAKQAINFPKAGPWQQTLQHPSDVWELPAFADIPAAGQRITAGRPVLTFFTRAPTAAGCMEELRRIAADLDRRLFSV